MSSASTKEHLKKTKQPSKMYDTLFFVICVVAVAAVLFFTPALIGKTGVSFLEAGSGLNKAVSVIIAVLVGWVALLPTNFYKQSISLIKGASIEWRKSVKPTKDEVVKTTMIVLAVVFAAAIVIAIFDWALFHIYNSFIR